MTLSILLKNPSGQKVTVKNTISDVSPGNSNRVQTKLARKNSRHFSCIFTHLQKRGVLQQNQSNEPTPFRPKGPSPCSSIWFRANTNAKPQAPSNPAPNWNSNLRPLSATLRSHYVSACPAA